MPASRRVAPQIDPRFAKFRMRVGKSRIHRLGVFAAEPIPAWRKVIEYTGERLSNREAEKRFLKGWRQRGASSIYFFEVNRRCVVDGAVGGSGAELINHCCDPNLRARKIAGRIFYFSRRRIRTGEELTVDYRYDRRARRVRCRCGARNCRGTINQK